MGYTLGIRFAVPLEEFMIAGGFCYVIKRCKMKANISEGVRWVQDDSRVVLHGEY